MFLVTVAAAVSIHWKRRYVTAIAFFVAGVLGIDTPFPSGLTDLEYLIFAIGAGYLVLGGHVPDEQAKKAVDIRALAQTRPQRLFDERERREQQAVSAQTVGGWPGGSRGTLAQG